MKSGSRRIKRLWLAMAFGMALALLNADAEPVTIYRDTWGVPHIYAKTDAAAAYGLGYAQAEDRLEDIYLNIRAGIGRMAEVQGARAAEQDYYMRILRSEELCKEWYLASPPELRALADGFIAGVKAFEAEHPEKVPAVALALEPWYLLSIGRAMILRWPLGTIMDDMRGARDFPGFGSNQWSVAPSRSADNCAILLTDPHLTWEGMAVFYEARVRGDKLHMNGFFLVGSPLLALGHNEHVGWAATTGGPDTSDVYAIKLDAGHKGYYEYDGEWRKLEPRLVKINVKDANPIIRGAAFTHLGPLLSEPNYDSGVAFVGASPYFEKDANLFDQTYAMCVAQNAEEFYRAIGMNQFMEQNLMYADTGGNIGYVRSGRVPIRPEGYDWSKPVPGHTSATAWKGIHPVEDLVQIMNPPQGYMQNCNISPANMMLDSPLTPDKYRDYLYNVSWDYNNTRSMAAVKLLSEDDSITVEDAKAIAMSVWDVRAKLWQDALDAAVKAAGAERMKDAAFEKEVDALLAWNGEFDRESHPAAVTRQWRLALLDSEPGKAIAEAVTQGKTLTPEQQTLVLETLDKTLAEIERVYGKRDIVLGDIKVVGRGGKYFPVGGADFGGRGVGSTTLFVAGTKPLDGQPGKFVAKSGSMSMLLMFMKKDGVESYSCIPWGQSADPASPHYMDQGEKLYGPRKFKPTWWKKEALLEHVESERTLEAQ